MLTFWDHTKSVKNHYSWWIHEKLLCYSHMYYWEHDLYNWLKKRLIYFCSVFSFSIRLPSFLFFLILAGCCCLKNIFIIKADIYLFTRSVYFGLGVLFCHHLSCHCFHVNNLQHDYHRQLLLSFLLFFIMSRRNNQIPRSLSSTLLQLENKFALVIFFVTFIQIKIYDCWLNTRLRLTMGQDWLYHFVDVA